MALGSQRLHPLVHLPRCGGFGGRRRLWHFSLFFERRKNAPRQLATSNFKMSRLCIRLVLNICLDFSFSVD